MSHRAKSGHLRLCGAKIQLIHRNHVKIPLRNYYICDPNPLSMISKELVQCTEDMRQAAQNGKISLDACVRAYDLLEKIMDLPDGGAVGPADIYSDTIATWCSSLGPAEEYCSEYRRLAHIKRYLRCGYCRYTEIVYAVYYHMLAAATDCLCLTSGK